MMMKENNIFKEKTDMKQEERKKLINGSTNILREQENEVKMKIKKEEV